MNLYFLPDGCNLPEPGLQAEHQALIDLLNRGLESVRAIPEPDVEMFFSVLEELRGLLGVHFAHEERVMARCRFPDLAAHSMHHDLCAAKLDRLGDMLQSGRLKPNRFLLDELFDLILDDLIRADGAFKSFLESSDVSIRTEI
jgi:hemerythrin-like metal-binding protein